MSAVPCFVPDHHCGLVLRKGAPDRWLGPGHHALPAEAGQTELRLLALGAPDDGPPSSEALRLPSTRSLLFVDGAHVATVSHADRPALSPLSMWEGSPPSHAAIAAQPEHVASSLPLAAPWWGLSSPTRSR